MNIFYRRTYQFHCHQFFVVIILSEQNQSHINFRPCCFLALMAVSNSTSKRDHALTDDAFRVRFHRRWTHVTRADEGHWRRTAGHVKVCAGKRILVKKGNPCFHPGFVPNSNLGGAIIKTFQVDKKYWSQVKIDSRNEFSNISPIIVVLSSMRLTFKTIVSTT